MNNRNYNDICPVCGYRLDFTPEVDDICPCCFFSFYISDDDWTYAQLRADWIGHGAQWAWGNTDVSAPVGWSPFLQFKNIGYNCTAEDVCNIVRFKPEAQNTVLFSVGQSGLTFEPLSGGTLGVVETREWSWRYSPQPNHYLHTLTC